MKQKLFLGALLLGALTLNSCVDDTESASVTAVRQAKAEQLKSLADLNKANAEAALITANATKAAQEAQAEYLKAQAQYYQAQAAYQQAQADYQNAENEKQKELAAIEIENQKMELEKARLAMENYKKQLEVTAAQLEANLLRAQADIENQKQALQEAINKADVKKQQELQNLLTLYNCATTQLFGVQKTLAGNEILLAKYKAGIVSAKEVAQELIDEYNQQITEKEQQIAANEEAINVLEADYSPTEAAENLAKAQLQLKTLDNDKNAKNEVLNNASTEQTDASSKLQNSPYVTTVVKDFIKVYTGTHFDYWNTGDYVYNFAINGIGIDLDSDSQYYSAIVPGKDGAQPTLIPIISGIISESKEKEYKYEGDDRSNFTYYTEYSEYYAPKAGGFDEYVKAVEASIAADQGKKESDAKTALDKANADLKAAEADYKTKNDAYEAAKKATAAAQKAYDDAVTAGKPAAETDPLNAKLTLAKSAEATAKTANDAAKTILGDKATDTTAASGAYKIQAEKELAYNKAKAALKAVNDQLAEIKESWAQATAKVSTNDAYVAAVNKANLEYADAWIAYQQVKVAYTKKNAEVTALGFVTTDPNVKDAATKIKDFKDENGTLTTDIKDLKEKIKTQTEVLNDPKFDDQKQIAEIEATIAGNKAEIEILQKKVDLYKAQLEKAMESDEPVNPAPAE